MLSLLLVENHPATRDYLAGVLRSAGHRVRVAPDATEAYELFASAAPDVVLMSLAFPQAAELLARVREASPQLPVLVFDHGHLGQLVGRSAAMRLKPDGYVADIGQRDLGDQLAAIETRRSGGAAPSGVELVLARAPVLQGQLKEATLPATAVMLLRTFRDGVLVLQQGEVERRIFLRLGVPAGFESSERSEAFDRWLLASGKITDAQLAEALRERAGGALSPAASLIAVGAVEPGQPLVALLREYTQAMLGRMVAMRQGRFRFHAGDEFVNAVQLVDIPALGYLLPGARAGLPLRTVLATLLPDKARFPRRTEAFSELLPQLALVPKDLRLALDLNGDLSLGELLAQRGGQLRELSSLIWFLKLVDAVAFDASRTASSGVVRPPSGERLRPLPPDQVTQIRESALAILPSTYFHALGVDIASSPDDVERAYLKVTEQLHPDRFAGFDLSEVGDLLAQVQDKLAAAHRTLSSPDKREGYLEHVLAKTTGLREGRPLSVGAEIAMKEAEKALAARKVRDAVERARQACQLHPREPDMIAHQAILELLDRSRPDDVRREAARRTARRALALEPESPRAMVALALLAREEGDAGEARKQVLAALKLRPKMELARWLLRELNRVP